MKKKQLEQILQSIPTYDDPKPELEQYVTPANIAADILYLAYNDIVDKKVIDLGCGTGIFSIGVKLLGAREVIGVDIDKSIIEKAKRFADSINLDIEYICCDISKFNDVCDTIFQNPPFGAQKKHRHIDRLFLKKAIEIAPFVYTLHLSETSMFIEKHVYLLGAKIKFKKNYRFPIPHTFSFHRRKKEIVDVTLFNIVR